MKLFQVNVAFFASFLVLIVMSCMALIFSMLLYLKTRAIRKLSKDLSIKVFNKTFNIFDPYPDRRKIIHNLISLIPIFATAGSLTLVFIMTVTVFEMGLLLSLIIFIICVNLIALDEASDVYKYAGIFIRAARNKASFGKGDLAAFYLIRESLPRLTMYYFFLAITFLILSIILPYIVPASLSALATFFLMFEFMASIETLTTLAPYFIVLLFVAISIIMVHVVVKKVKSKIVGFPIPESAPVLDLEAIKDKLALGHGALLAGADEKVEKE
ncbi:MAG: hypothetical protein QXN95_01050 [Candidatus Bathyarchaeia archaeon]